MMERKVLLICFVAGFLGLLSAATGFGAEGTRIKSSQVQVTAISECVYPRSPAMALGLTSALSLMIAQIIINVSTGCICCKRNPHPSNSNWTVALICFVVSWFTFVIAFLLLLTGAALNDQHGDESAYFNYYCYVVKPGVFAGGAMLSLASVALGIIYYLTLTSAKNGDSLWGNPSTPNQGGIAMGQPQIPPGLAQSSTQDPVFVHEDTYIRRQFT
ncbi:protein MODIFYING WALL LIGNIN-2-like isoform X2 [Quercus robur]|uniref:protein MODIFYING WALL LIGNIN-2-like isoform X1 n=1 Tax=Quercus robur TaxID=38942 RepID=UPI00216332BB|nr:protein MODIFYING WALL LIGNIN-2-like isoform X1 [Quercus robur]XP_050254192.1 protein MODIFYING WALL LIGNIN-2-like isoform X2 [Quercus robur]